MIAIVHETPWRLLRERLDLVVAAHPDLAPARAVVTGPVALLAALGEDADTALGDDRQAIDRFRLLLSLSSTQAPPLGSMRALLEPAPRGHGRGASVPAVRRVASAGATPVLDAGALVIAGLAAGRVGADVGLADAFVDHVLALAFAATPAEALWRAIAAGISGPQLVATLQALMPREAGDRRISATISAFVGDPVERARWLALDTLFGQVRASVKDVAWDGATSDGLLDVIPRAACAGAELRVVAEPTAPPVILLSSLTPPPPASPLDELTGGGRVVFASPGRPAVAVVPSDIDPQAGQFTVRVPARARPGWIGVTSDARVAFSNESRTRLRATWSRLNGELSALSGAPVPVDRVPLLASPATPPQLAAARFDGGKPLVAQLAVTPDPLEPGGQARVEWRVAGAKTATLTPGPGAIEPAGSAEIDVPRGARMVEVTLRATGPCGRTTARAATRVRLKIEELDVHESGTSLAPQPGEPATVTARLSAAAGDAVVHLIVGGRRLLMTTRGASATAEIAGGDVRDGLEGRVEISVGRAVDDARDFGPLDLRAPARRRLVLVRPAVVGREVRRIEPAEAADALVRAGRERGVRFDVVDAPWIESAELTIEGAAGGPETPATRRLLERLNILATETSGLEDAVWVALLPEQRSPVQVAQPADNAAGLVVATPAGLAASLSAPPPATGASADRLSIVGTVDVTGRVRVARVRRERRPIGAGSPVESGMAAVAMDARGRDIASVPLKLQGSVLPAAFVVQVPLAPDAAHVEIRVVESSELIDLTRFVQDPNGSTQWVARRLDRVGGEPALDEVTLDRRELSWRYRHGRGVRPAFVIELRRHGAWWPMLRPGACADSVLLPLEQFAPATDDDAVRVAASDGWHTAVSDAVDLPKPRDPGVVLRSAGGGRFWADLGGREGRVSWVFGRQTRAGAVVTAPAGYTGPVRLVVNTGRGVIERVRVIDRQEGRDVLRLR